MINCPAPGVTRTELKSVNTQALIAAGSLKKRNNLTIFVWMKFQQYKKNKTHDQPLTGETFEQKKQHFITLIYRSDRPAPFEFQRRLLALRSKVMFPPTPAARCSSSLLLPPIMLMVRMRSPSSHRMLPLSQSRYRS